MPKHNFEREKGFAMVLTLFLVIAVMALSTGGFLNMARHQRTIQREIDRVKVYWAAEALFEGASKAFRDYLKIENVYPPTENNTLGADGEEVKGFDKIEPDSSYSFFKDLLADLHDTKTHPLINKSRLVSRGSISVKQVQSSPDDGSRTFKVEVALSTRNLSETVFQQELIVGSGNIFDFGIFYEGDLEMSSGADAYFQGPIFANGDVYLMPGEGKKITLVPTFGEYAIAMHGNLYYYFKPAVGKNYLLERSSFYRNAIPAYLRTDNQQIITNGYNFDPANGPVTDPYYKHNTYIPLSLRICGADRCRAGYENTKPWSVSTDPYMELSGGYRCDEPATCDFARFPVFYHIRNEIRNIYPGVKEDQNRIFIRNLLNKSGSSYEDIEIEPFRAFTRRGQVYPSTIYFVTFFNKDLYQDPAYCVDKTCMSSSAAYDFGKFYRKPSDWSVANPSPTGKAPLNPGFPNQIAAKSLGSLVKMRQPKKVLALGDVGGNNHMLIEPLNGDETPAERRAKLQTQSEVWIMCNDPACSTFKCQKNMNGEVTSFDGICGDGAIISKATIYDYRLDQSLPIVDIDVGRLTTYILAKKDNVQDTGHKGHSIYIQTKSGGSYGKTSIRGVRLKNGATLPPNGLSFVTNGRLWIQGDYNTVEHTYGGEDGDQYPAPASIFSDSFGVLSNEWDDAYGLLTQKAARRVENSVTVNTAVVTGSLKSQLEELYPNCMVGNTINISNYLAGCMDGHVVTNHSSTGAEELDKWAEIKNSSWISAHAKCPNGLNMEGMPNTPSDCTIWVDKETGIPYYRKLVIIRETYRRAYLKRHYPELFNSIGDFSTSPNAAQEAEVPYERLPSDLDADGLADVDWRNFTGDEALRECAQDNCWTTKILNVTRTQSGLGWRTMNVDISKNIPAGSPEMVDIGVIDSRSIYTLSNTPIPSFDGYWQATYSRKVLTFPRWEIPFAIDPNSHRVPRSGIPYANGISLEDHLPPEGVAIVPGVLFMLFHESNNIYHEVFSGMCSNWVTTYPRVDPGCTEGCATYMQQVCTSIQAVRPGIAYVHGREFPLHKNRYSGGVENLINFQEDWREDPNVPFNFFGALASPWNSQELVKLNGAQAYWNPRTSPLYAYYSAPWRGYNYNAYLRNNQPPAAPDVFSVQRGKYKETVQAVQPQDS